LSHSIIEASGLDVALKLAAVGSRTHWAPGAGGSASRSRRSLCSLAVTEPVL
jgi:hypothetical protein